METQIQKTVKTLMTYESYMPYAEAVAKKRCRKYELLWDYVLFQYVAICH